MALQRRGGKVVFTNGCFDLLHAGHVRYLTEARSLGDALIVAVNSDRSVRKIKGPTRPIVPQAQRLIVLSALSSIDWIIVFSAQTPEKLIALLAPDILVKGDDWALSDIVGRATVEARGGCVKRIKTIPRLSTTRMIERILSLFHPRSLANT